MSAAFNYLEYQKLQLLANPAPGTESTEDAAVSSNRTSQTQQTRNRLWNRGTEESAVWQMSQVSTPPGADWEHDSDYTFLKGDLTQHRYYFEGDDPGAGQYIYVMEAAIDEASVVSTYLSLP